MTDETTTTPPTPEAAPPDEVAEHEMPQSDEEAIGARINRLSGEPAPDISPEEFARLQRGGALNIDSRGRIRVGDDDSDDVGVSLRKRRAWY